MDRLRAAVTWMFAGLCLVAATPLAWSSGLTTTYSYGTAFNNQRSMLRLSDGTLVFMYQKGAPVAAGGGLVLVVSEDDGATWTQVLQVAAIYNVFPDLVAGPGRSVYVVYSTNSDGAGTPKDAEFAKVEYDANAQAWIVSRRTFIVDAGATNGAFNAVIAHDGTRLWSALRYYEGGNYSIRVYVSLDEGATWSYAMEADTPGPNTDETAVLVPVGSKLALVYYHQDSQFRWRVRDYSAAPNVWGASQLIHQITTPLGSKSGYSVLADDNGQLHLAFGEQGLQHYRTVGGVWQATPTEVSPVGVAPALATDGKDIWAVWEETVGANQFTMMMQRYDGGTGTWDPTRTSFNHPSESLAEAAWCYSATAGTWSDVTLGAGNTTSNDVVHATTQQTLRDPGDALYVGMPAPVSYLYVLLGTAGVGGDAVWEYWNGAAWTTFVPASGPCAFTASQDVCLWPNIGQGPADWAPLSVNGSAPLYYVRATATVSYGTPPRANQVTSFERNRYAKVVARDPAGLTLAWTRGLGGPFAVETRGTIPWVQLGGDAAVSAVGIGRPRAALEQNRPNPFHPSTAIRFSLASAGPVRLAVYDLRGRSVAMLAEGTYPAGAHEVVWDGRATGGAAAAPGVYWYRLEANGALATRRMILLSHP